MRIGRINKRPAAKLEDVIRGACVMINDDYYIVTGKTDIAVEVVRLKDGFFEKFARKKHGYIVDAEVVIHD